MADQGKILSAVSEYVDEAVKEQQAKDATAYAALQAEYDQYRASHPDQPTPVPVVDPTPAPVPEPVPEPTPEPVPVPVVTKPLWGVSYKATADTGLIAETNRKGHVKVARIYFQGMANATWKDKRIQRAIADGCTAFVLTCKDKNLANSEKFLAAIPAGYTVYYGAFHEPENNIDDPKSAQYAAWAAEWRTLQEKLAPIVRAHGAIPTTITQGSTLWGLKGRKVTDWMPAKGSIDVFAFDSYLNGYDPVQYVAKMVAAAKLAGAKATAVGETGIAEKTPERLKQLTTFKAELVKAKVPFACYWDSQVSAAEPDFRWDTATANAWLGLK